VRAFISPHSSIFFSWGGRSSARLSLGSKRGEGVAGNFAASQGQRREIMLDVGRTDGVSSGERLVVSGGEKKLVLLFARESYN